jgi:hypothetical protein
VNDLQVQQRHQDQKRHHFLHQSPRRFPWQSLRQSPRQSIGESLGNSLRAPRPHPLRAFHAGTCFGVADAYTARLPLLHVRLFS